VLLTQPSVIIQTCPIDYETKVEAFPNPSTTVDKIGGQTWRSTSDETLQRKSFSSRFKLAIIQRRVQTLVSSLALQQQDKTNILQSIEDLNRELEAWKVALPGQWQPPPEPRPILSSSLAPIIQLHILYHCTALALHHASIMLAYLLSGLPHEVREAFMLGSGPLQIRRSMDACLTEARSMIATMQHVPSSPGGNALNLWVSIFPIL